MTILIKGIKLFASKKVPTMPKKKYNNEAKKVTIYITLEKRKKLMTAVDPFNYQT